MKRKIHRFSVLTVIIFSAAMVVLFTGCENGTPGIGEQGIADSENGTANVSLKIGSGDLYTPKGSKLSTSTSQPNCHFFAWQTYTGIPQNLPKYHLETPALFINDGSYILVGQGSSTDKNLPSGVRLGDKVVYGTQFAHSAVVVNITAGDPQFISYFVGDDHFTNHKPYLQGFPSDLYYYRIFDEKYGNLPPNCPRKKIALMAYCNDLFVCADKNEGSTGPLYSNRPWILEWETFYMCDLGDNTYAFWSFATGRYVEASETNRAVADMGSIWDWCTFKFEYYTTKYNGLQYYCLQSTKNKKWVHYDSFVANCAGTGDGSAYHIVILE
jgi:hypothetical protein